MNAKPWTLLGSAVLALSLLVACGPAPATLYVADTGNQRIREIVQP